MDEFALIDGIRRILEGGRPNVGGVVLGIGDDAAVLDPGGEMVVATTDSLVEGTHFEWGWCSPRDVGYKAVAVNLSDIAAMGSRPLGLLVSVSIPESMSDSDVLDVARGVGEAATRFESPVAGGNVTSTPGSFEVTITALGLTEKGRYLKRSGAAPGDVILVSGCPGSARIGRWLLAEGNADGYPMLVEAFMRPVPRLGLGAMLCREEGAHCAIDVSDGLLADLGHLLTASGVGAVLDLDAMPLDPESGQVHEAGGPDPMEAALNGGDDYELVACVNPAISLRFQDLGMSLIGHVTDERGRLDLRLGGEDFRLPAVRGFKHR